MGVDLRRYDLDWLRVMAFGSLILYHIGMFYVTWDFHVKSIHSDTTFEPAMKLLNPWRLSLLFLISGIAIRFAVDKADLRRLALQRSKTLLIPIVFGMLVIVAPQSWLELLEKGETTANFGRFYLQYLSAYPDFSIVVPTWNHLWYVVYILVYTLVLMPIARPLSGFLENTGKRLMARLFSKRLGTFCLIALPVSIFYLHHIILRPYYPSTHALTDDWANHQLYFSIFVLGFLVAKDMAFWSSVRRALFPSLLLVLLLALTSSLVWYWESLGIKSDSLVVLEFLSERARKTAFAWFSIVALLSACQRWLNKPSAILSYMNQAIFSWYILHQTLIVMIGYWLTRQGLSFYTELMLLVFSTYLACLLLYEYLIRRQKWLHPLFGVKLSRVA